MRRNPDSRETDFARFVGFLEKAGAAMSNPHYFQLPVAELDEPIFRERVYCYELYHQLRLTMPDGGEFPYELHGEIDKSGHLLIMHGPGKLIPDFLVHVPGSMKRNLAIIEVKAATATPGYLKTDVTKLRDFVQEWRYYRGIMLIYGDGSNDTPPSLENARNLIGTYPIRLMWHPGPGTNIETID